MSVHSLEPILSDSFALGEIASETKLAQAQVRAVLAELDELPIRQVLRMAKAARAARDAAANRAKRLSR